MCIQRLRSCAQRLFYSNWMNRATSKIFNVQWNVWIWNDQIISSHRKCSFDHRFFALRRPSKPPKWINRANSFAMSLISYNIFCLHNTEICTQHEQIFEMRLNHSDIYLEFDIFERILWWTALMTQLRSTGIPLELSLIFLQNIELLTAIYTNSLHVISKKWFHLSDDKVFKGNWK